MNILDFLGVYLFLTWKGRGYFSISYTWLKSENVK